MNVLIPNKPHLEQGTAAITLPAPLKQVGYVFKGWAEGSESTEVVEVPAEASKDVTYYALWEVLPPKEATTVDPNYTGDDLHTFTMDGNFADEAAFDAANPAA